MDSLDSGHPDDPFEDLPPDYDLNKIHVELEKLNIATDVINKLELQLDEARSAFKEIQTSWTHRLEILLKKHGGCIEKSRPYYEARMRTRAVQQDAQRAAYRFEKANAMHAVAKEQVMLTQDSLARQPPKSVEPACLEVLNHHIGRVNDAERERMDSEHEHRGLSMAYAHAMGEVARLEKDLKRSIAKSRSYFDARVEFTKVLEKQKELIKRLESEIKQKKKDYATSLKRLEEISDEIHEMRSIGSRSSVAEPSSHRGNISSSGISAGESTGSEAGFSAQLAGTSPKTTAGTSGPPRRESIDDTALLRVMQLARSDTRDRAGSAPPDPQLKGLASGIILLANQLAEYSFLDQTTRSRAFQLPEVSEMELDYRTQPAGVKPLPTPPQSPIGSASSPTMSSAVSLNSFPDTDTEARSVLQIVVSPTDDERIERYLANHDNLIESIQTRSFSTDPSPAPPPTEGIIKKLQQKTAGDLSPAILRRNLSAKSPKKRQSEPGADGAVPQSQ